MRGLRLFRRVMLWAPEIKKPRIARGFPQKNCDELFMPSSLFLQQRRLQPVLPRAQLS
jgi:hypothetical protein